MTIPPSLPSFLNCFFPFSSNHRENGKQVFILFITLSSLILTGVKYVGCQQRQTTCPQNMLSITGAKLQGNPSIRACGNWSIQNTIFLWLKGINRLKSGKTFLKLDSLLPGLHMESYLWLQWVFERLNFWTPSLISEQFQMLLFQLFILQYSVPWPSNCIGNHQSWPWSPV